MRRGPVLRAAFRTYLGIPEREALVPRHGEFPCSGAQAAVIELIARPQGGLSRLRA